MKTSAHAPDTPTRFSSLDMLTLVLSIYVLGAISAQTFLNLSEDTNLLLDRIDTIICFVFLYDFFARWYLAPNKLSFLKWGWIDFVTSIPAFDFLRWGRLVRVIRLFRILRAFRSIKVLIGYIYRNKAKGTFMTVALISIILTIFSSIAILNLETDPESNIKSPADALWWAVATITTVGYGDRFPVTTEGRIVAAILMTAGVGLFGTFTGYVATFFLESEIEHEENDIDRLIREVKSLRERLESLENTINEKLRTPDDDGD